MKKIIYIFGIIFLSIVLILNLLFTANLSASEQITIRQNSITYIGGSLLLAILIFFATRMLDKHLYDDIDKKKKVRKKLLIIAVAIYIVFNIVWVITVRPGMGGDQVHVGCTAQGMFRGNLEEVLKSITYADIPLGEYLQAYKQQITLAFVYSIFYRIIHFDALELLRVPNIIGNALIIVGLYKINKQLSKKYETNKTLLFTLILTFISIPMLSTFAYGDVPSLALCLFSVYLMMRYTETNNWRYAIGASALTAIAYMMRMNSLIFIIATTMYLVLNLFKRIREKPWKENLISICIIILYIVISIIPSSIIQSYYFDKYNLDRNKPMPSINYILMAMEEGPRGNGWYSESIGEYALRNPEAAKEEYKEKVKERLNYFVRNPGYAFDFYNKKITSMWAENTYSAITNNITKENDPIENIREPLTFYQKALIIIIFLCSLIVLIQNRKNLSLDILFLITIFIGGFAFHILWEAKSRYIIPYIVVLIPVASISIQKINISFKKSKVG